MSETLLVHYSPDQPLSGVVLNEKGAIASPPEQFDTERLKTLARGRRLRLLFDGAYLNIESVNIPGNNRQRQLQAAPYALEDNLARDIDELHFALGKKQADGNIPVIAIDHQVLQNCLQFFQQLGLTPEFIGVDILALPYQQNSWTVLLTEQAALIRTSPGSGLYSDRDNLLRILTSLRDTAGQAAQTLQLIHLPQDEEFVAECESLDMEISTRSYTEFPLQILAAQINDGEQINLLQGAYKPQRKGSELWKYWKSVAGLAALWIVLQLVATGIETQQLQKKNSQLSSQLEKVFKQANPGARKFNNMRKRMERRLKELQNGTGSDSSEVFLQLLSETAPALSRQEKINITAMVYRNKRIDIELSSDSLQTLEAVKTQLGSLPKIKTVLSTSVEKDKVSGRLRLEKQG